MEYSRDAQAGPLNILERLLDAVRLSFFDPDATRSGCWRQGFGPEVLSRPAPAPSASSWVVVENNTTPVVQGSSSSGAAAAAAAEVLSESAPDKEKSDASSTDSSAVASSASSSGSGDEVEGLVGLADLSTAVQDVEDTHDYVFNSISLTRHIVDTTDMAKAACVYLVDKSIFVWGGAPLMPICKRCSRRLETQ